MKNNGFTLVELLAVIVILAIVLAIAIPSISGIIESSKTSAFGSDYNILLKTIDYKMELDETFDPTNINETNIKTLLDIDGSNYQSITIKKMNGILYITVVGKNGWRGLTMSGPKTLPKVSETVTTLVRGANAPVLVTGMTPIKWNGTTWVDTTSDDVAWYNYDTSNKIWANARTADGSMWVWIPRYIYKISSGWHTNTAGTIDIQFSKGVDDNWNKSVIGNIDLGETANASNNKWTNHPAFTFGDTELTGIWVAKFEASGATNAIDIIPNVPSLRNIIVGDMFTASRNMETNSRYGWGTTGSGIDTHMMKNTEWGVVAYLSKSSYGKNAEIWVNPANNYTTGCAGDSVNSASTTGCLRTYDTANGQQSSSTGNIYGIYDISGGAWEYQAAYVNNTDVHLNQGSSIKSATDKYKNVYVIGSPDDQAPNYSLTINSKGDAVYETSSTVTPNNSSWFSDLSGMAYAVYPWVKRGNSYSGSSGAGAFALFSDWGLAGSNTGFRPILLISEGL